MIAENAMLEGFNELVIALAMGVLLIFLVMAAQFESYIDPVAIMFALPLAIIGAILGLFITGSQLSVMSLIGVILLMGLVAKNGILLVDYAKKRRSEGVERNKALIEAGLVRFRPIVMTSLAMIFGMMPSAISESRRLGDVCANGPCSYRGINFFHDSYFVCCTGYLYFVG